MSEQKVNGAAETAEMGRPPFEPTEKQRGIVETLAAMGLPQAQIADFPGIEISEHTLRKHFRRELNTGLSRVLYATFGNLARAAMGSPAVHDKDGKLIQAEQKPEAWAICFLLKTKGKHLGFSEKIVVAGDPANPVQHKHSVADEVRKLIQDEIGTLPAPAITAH